MFESIADLKNRLASAEHTLKQTKERIAKEDAEKKERDQIEARLAQIAAETEALRWRNGNPAL